MIQLTESLIAVEVPNDLPVEKFEVVQTKGETRLYGYGELDRIGIWHLFDWIEDCSLVSVTPLDEKQAKRIVDALTERSLSMILLHGYKNYDSSKKYKSCYPFIQATQSFNSLLESKGLDINKKYAIIKIEK